MAGIMQQVFLPNRCTFATRKISRKNWEERVKEYEFYNIYQTILYPLYSFIIGHGALPTPLMNLLKTRMAFSFVDNPHP